MDIESVFRFRDGSSYSMPIAFKTPADSKGNEVKSDIVELQDLYIEERNASPWRYYGTIESVSPLSGRKASPTLASDLFQRVSEGAYNFLSDFSIYCCSFDGFEVLADGSKRERWKNLGTGLLVDVLRAGFSESIYGESRYNFIVNADFDDIDRIAICVDLSGNTDGQIVYGEIIDASGNTDGYDMGSYSIDLGAVNPITIRMKYRKVYPLPKPDNAPFTSGKRYSFSNIVFALKADMADERTSCLFEPYKLLSVESLGYSAKLDSGC